MSAVAETRGEVPMCAVLGAVARGNGIPVERITGRDRTPEIVAIRRDAIRAVATLGYSTLEIGVVFGRHHTTILHYLDRLGRANDERDPDA